MSTFNVDIFNRFGLRSCSILYIYDIFSHTQHVESHRNERKVANLHERRTLTCGISLSIDTISYRTEFVQLYYSKKKRFGACVKCDNTKCYSQPFRPLDDGHHHHKRCAHMGLQSVYVCACEYDRTHATWQIANTHTHKHKFLNLSLKSNIVAINSHHNANFVVRHCLHFCDEVTPLVPLQGGVLYANE